MFPGPFVLYSSLPTSRTSSETPILPLPAGLSRLFSAQSLRGCLSVLSRDDASVPSSISPPATGRNFPSLQVTSNKYRSIFFTLGLSFRSQKSRAQRALPVSCRSGWLENNVLRRLSRQLLWEIILSVATLSAPFITKRLPAGTPAWLRSR